jgi:Cu+-exporting ATPase
MAHKIDTVVFDKTGTLTKGEPELTDVVTLGGMGSDEVLELAASVEKNSEHPLGEAIVNGALARDLDLTLPEDFTSITGKGVEGNVAGRRVVIGNRGYFTESGVDLEEVGEVMTGLAEQENGHDRGRGR